MKILSLLFRIVTLAVVVALGTLWFLNKDELSAIQDSYKNAAQELNVPDAPLSDVLKKGMNDLSDTQDELKESQARAAGLDQRLASTREELSSTEDQLRATNQKLRNTQRDLETAQTEKEEADEVAEQLTAQLKTVRNDLIRVNKEKFELSQRIESVEDERRALARRVQQLEDMEESPTEVAGGETDEEETGETADQVARLREQLDAAREELSRLSENQLGAALAVPGSGDSSLAPNQVRVKSLSLERGMVVLSPSSSDEFVGVSNLKVDRDGTPIADLRIRGVYPDYVVADILPSSVFADALKKGSVYSIEKQ
ncbi:MAG: hypothetical protein ACLFRP_07220 [Puniceicoccaceae bacterium]